MHRVRGASGDVRVLGPGFPPRSPPLSAPLAPCFHPPATLLWDRLAQQDERTPSPAPRSSPSPAGGRTGVAPRNFPGRDGPRALPPSSPSPLPRTRESLPPIAVVRTSVGRSPPHPPKVAKTSPNKVAPSKMAKQCVPPSLRLPVRLPPAAPPAAPPPPGGGRRTAADLGPAWDPSLGWVPGLGPRLGPRLRLVAEVFLEAVLALQQRGRPATAAAPTPLALGARRFRRRGGCREEAAARRDPPPPHQPAAEPHGVACSAAAGAPRRLRRSIYQATPGPVARPGNQALTRRPHPPLQVAVDRDQR